MCCAPTERRVSLLEARKTSDGTYPADPNAQPLSERAANACPMSRSDPCRIFLSDRLLEESIATFQRQLEISPDSAEVWSNLGSAFARQENHAVAAAAYAKGLEVQPEHLTLLTNDAELALIQGDKDRFHARIATALPQVTAKDQDYAIFLPFLVWLDNPTQGWESVMTAIRKLESGVTFKNWNFSTTERAIVRLDLDASTQQTAHYFIAFFTRQIDLPTLEERLTGR
jgi:tetratricopeptide (TPR) repeat protein